MAIKAIIFDMDGLMLDTERVNLSCWRRTFLEAGLPFYEQVLLDARGKNFMTEYAAWQKRLGPDVDFEALHQKKLAYANDFFEKYGTPVKTGLHALIDWLKENSYRLALATSTAEEKARRQLTEIGVYDKFDIYTYGPMVQRYKPEPISF